MRTEMARADASALQKGQELLRQWLGASDLQATSVVQLLDLIGRDPAADLAIVARLAAIGDEASAVALRSIESSSTDKAVHKETRRALYRLQQKGIAAPASPAVAPTTSLGPSLEGYLSPIDGNGDQLVWLVKARPSGVGHLYAVLNDPEGLREVDLFETTRKSLREARQSLLERNEIRMVEADWRYCDFLIDRALQWAKQRQGNMHGDYPRLRSLLVSTPPQALPSPIYAHLSADEIRSDRALEADSLNLLTEPEMRTWFLPHERLAPYLEEAEKVRNSLVVLPEAQQKERLRMVDEQALREIFGGAMQASWVRRLENMAYYFHKTGHASAARRALAAALALDASKDAGVGVAFCEALVGSGLAYWQEVAAQQAAEQSRGQLVMTPEQARRELQRRS